MPPALEPNLANRPDRVRQLDLAFKGGRSYLHSTDLHEAILEWARQGFGAEAHVANLTLRRPATGQVALVFRPDPEALGSFRIRRGGDPVDGWIVGTGAPVTRHRPYDERAVVDQARPWPGGLRLDRPVPGFTPFEQLVALLRAAAGAVRPGPWVVCQADLDGPLAPGAALAVRLARNIRDTFLVFELFQDGAPLGSIRGLCDAETPEPPPGPGDR